MSIESPPGPRILRLIGFYVVSILVLIWFSITSILFCTPLPYRIRSKYLMLWNVFSIGWGRLACSVDYRITGGNNIPTNPVVVMCKHESQWETIFLQILLRPVSTVLKKELLSIPGFGWGLRQMQPIGIDRSTPRGALKQIIEEGCQRLDQGLSVLIFPEGTRTKPGDTGKFARSGAKLAIKANVPVLPVAHNAGVYWPAKRLVRYPGTIDVVIGAPIEPEGKTAAEITELAESWIRETVIQINRTGANGEHTSTKSSPGSTEDTMAQAIQRVPGTRAVSQ